MDYSRQELVLGKADLTRKTALIIGLGAIGSNSANLLARSGLKLILVDNDKVELPNINSQSIYTKDDINKSKALQLASHLRKVNKNITAYGIRIDSSNLSKLPKPDIVLDCTDNMETRFVINDYCKKNSIPLIHSAAIKSYGTIFVVCNGPCLRCIYSNNSIFEDCSISGILNTTSSLISSIQCNEALKILAKKPYEKTLLRVNLKNNEITKIKVNKRCNLCIDRPMKQKLIVKKCSDKGGYSVTRNPIKPINLKSIKKHFNVLAETPIVLVIKEKYEIIIHNYGELLFKNAENTKEIEKIARKVFKNA